MWTLIQNAVDAKVIDNVIKDAAYIEDISEKNHFVNEGRRFFKTSSGLEHLHNLVGEICKRVDFFEHLDAPEVQHAYLLYKSAEGVATKLHQDRTYWFGFEDESKTSMLTCWVFLEDIGVDKACLRLNRDNFFDLKDGYLFNKEKTILEHDKEERYVDGFTKVIVKDLRDAIEEKMSPITGKKGDVVIFDAYEPHSSMPNVSGETRKALKIVIGSGLNKYLISLRDLEHQKYTKCQMNEFKNRGMGFVRRLLKKG